MEKDFEEKVALGEWIRGLPAAEPPAGMAYRIMERVRTEAERRRRRGERLYLTAVVALVVLAAAGGVGALWLFVPSDMPFRSIDGLPRASVCAEPAGNMPFQWETVHIYLIALATVVLLMLFDYGMRRVTERFLRSGK